MNHMMHIVGIITAINTKLSDILSISVVPFANAYFSKNMTVFLLVLLTNHNNFCTYCVNIFSTTQQYTLGRKQLMVGKPKL